MPKTEEIKEVRCPVDHLLLFKYFADCGGTVVPYCRRCKLEYEVKLPEGVLKALPRSEKKT